MTRLGRAIGGLLVGIFLISLVIGVFAFENEDRVETTEPFDEEDMNETLVEIGESTLLSASLESGEAPVVELTETSILECKEMRPGVYVMMHTYSSLKDILNNSTSLVYGKVTDSESKRLASMTFKQFTFQVIDHLGGQVTDKEITVNQFGSVPQVGVHYIMPLKAYKNTDSGDVSYDILDNQYTYAVDAEEGRLYGYLQVGEDQLKDLDQVLSYLRSQEDQVNQTSSTHD